MSIKAPNGDKKGDSWATGRWSQPVRWSNAPVGERLEITWVCVSCQQNVSRRRLPDPAVSALIRVPRAPAVPPGPAPARRFLRSHGGGALFTPARTRTARRTVPAATSPPQESQPNTLRIPAPPIRGVVIHNHDRSPCAGLSGRETGPALKQSGRHQTTFGTCDTPETHLTLECSREPAQRSIAPVVRTRC
jgi:hypothetical protein